ncbi:MAG: Ig-like domain-containing protein, partial [Methylophilaceae bacterium]|nr:Ig-like domain-containing protein [Methylophilaceae bacterium]
VNGQTVTATYASGSGTNLLTFSGGTVPATGDGTAISITSINLNSGTVTGNLSAQGLVTTSVGQSYAGYTVDNTALAPTLTLASDTGISASDGLTNNATINVSGLENGATWQYQVDNGTTWVTGTGASFTASDGTHSYLVRQIDVAGNTSVTSTATYTLDTSPPGLMEFVLPNSSVLSANNFTGNGITVAENSTYVGWLFIDPFPSGEIVTWSLDSGVDASRFSLTYNQVNSTNGVLSFTNAPNYEAPRGSAFNAASNNDTYRINVIATDKAGNAEMREMRINVTDVNEAPTLGTNTANQTTVIGQNFSVNTASAFSDPDNETNSPAALAGKWGTLTYTASGLLGGLNINASTGV